MKTRTLALPVLMLSLALSSACTTMTSSIPASNLPVYLGFFQHTDMQRKYLERYACRDHTPLSCQCTSTSPTAMCSCGCGAP
jgi:hypothetical protein